MRRDPEHFGDEDLLLVHVAKRLNEALRTEEILTSAGIDYAVETDEYVAGFLLRRRRVGAFFYVREADAARARHLLEEAGFVLPRVVNPE